MDIFHMSYTIAFYKCLCSGTAFALLFHLLKSCVISTIQSSAVNSLTTVEYKCKYCDEYQK